MKIQFLEIKTSRLDQQSHFYGKVLGLEILRKTGSSFEVRVGFSVLKFKQDPFSTPYHIAFHIGAHQEHTALVWLKERVGILKNEEEEIIDFSSWNAKSVYFYDPDKNIMEFISRGHLYPTHSKEFTNRDIIGISEIGLATDDVLQCYTYLNQEIGLTKYTGDYETFCATGDDEGLFIIANYVKKTWFPADDQPFPSPFSITLANNEGTTDLLYEEGVLRRPDDINEKGSYN